jgi:multidrug resistance protein MdtO
VLCLHRRRLAGHSHDYVELWIVAQPGLGATLQKTWLRIGGALLATLIALILIVFVQPWTDSLSGLLAMTLPVFALAAWIAAGSERIAYAGIQIGFTFALAFLSWFGPLSNLTELRDRVIGILLGVLVSSLVHLYLWPDSEAPQLKARLAQLYRQLAQTLSARNDEVQLVPLFAALTESETLLNRVAAEPLAPTRIRGRMRKTGRYGRHSVRQRRSCVSAKAIACTPRRRIPLARCAGRLEGYAADIDQQQTQR